MNNWIKHLLVAALVLTGGRIGFSEPAKTAPAKPAPALSVFTQPANVREGRDPFYPESPRLFEATAAASHAAAAVVEATILKVSGFSIANGKRMVIINNHTFAGGDEGDVLTASGRTHIRCLEIRSDAVVVEINGRRRELTFVQK
jgi:hypothetical protein